MSTGYSAHPDLASEQLQNAKNAETSKTKAHRLGSPQHSRRHNSAGFFNFSPFRSRSIMAKNAELSPQTIDAVMATTNTNSSSPQKTLPDRTRIRGDDGDGDGDDKTEHDTKDCVDCAPSGGGPRIVSNDVVDHRLQHQPYDCDPQSAQPTTTISTSTFNPESCPSGLSSAISSPSASTVSSPLSTPTRLTTQLHHSHQHCCRKSSILPDVSATVSHYQQHHHHSHQHHHYHHHHHHHHHSQNASSSASASASTSASSSASAVAGGCKKLQKFDPRFGPSPYRQLLPIILCILSFAAVFTILIIYMDTTEIRHQQFRLNMSRDYDLYGVAQDDPTLIAFLREIHMRKYPMHFLKSHADPTTATVAAAAASSSTVSASGTLKNFSGHHDGLVPEMAHYVAGMVGGKVNGATIQSLTGAFGQLITAPWLAETLNWAGIIVEPEPRRYFALRKQNDHRPYMQVVHACVSPNPYPKEVTIHNEESDVRINSLLDEETSWFNSRVKCFPLYTIMLACNRVEYDLLSLGVHGHELEILQTLPFDKIKIEVISIHLPDNMDKAPYGYIQTITKFLAGKGYKLQKTFGSNYFYQRINTNRTRKKDILLLKTP